MQITNQPRFGFETNWSQVSKPSGSNIISKVVHAAVAVFVNLAKSLVNTIIWPVNKLHSIVYPNAMKNVEIAEDAEIQHDSVMVDVAEEAPVDEDLPEPVLASSNETLMKVGMAGGLVAAALIGTAVLARGTQYFIPGKIPGVETVDTFFSGTIPDAVGSAASAGAGAAKWTFCTATFGKICDPTSYAGQ